MKIATDLDDCILDTVPEILKVINKKLDASFKKEDITGWDLNTVLNIPKSQKEIVKNCIEKTILNTREIPVIPWAINALNWFSTIYEENIYILTRRPRKTWEITHNSLLKAGLGNFYLYANCLQDPFYRSKSERINKEGIEVIIEDCPEEIEDIYKNTQCQILVMDQPWNQYIKENNRINIVRNWAEIRNIITLM